MVNLDNEISDVFLSVAINKAIAGESDSDGNYIFEVEASNENLDLQNQYVQQKALTGSQEYFLTNGVISDDHQHKTRNEKGDIETHKDKIIGEPLKVWTDGSKTFVKGKLYGNNKFAKDYINLLKAGSTRVHASVGGIMPKVRKNADGTETVTSFMWNDLALTCSPVNWTVGSAKFAKSMTNVDFCKALTAGSGTDASLFDSGRALQNEEVEEGITDILEMPTIEKSDEDIIRELVVSMTDEGFDDEEAMVTWLLNRGFNELKARAAVREIISEGEKKMAKGFFNSVSSILKSKDCKKSEECEKSEVDSEEEKGASLFDDTDDTEDEKEDDEEDVKKSYDEDFSYNSSDEDDEWIDASVVIKSFNDKIEAQADIIKSQKEEIEELRKSVLECANAIVEIGSVPETRSTVMQKSISASEVPTGKISQDDFTLFKKSLENAFKESDKTMADIAKSQRLNSAFQRKMAGEAIAKSDWKEICDIVHKYGK